MNAVAGKSAPPRFVALDGLRGIAALAVLHLHVVRMVYPNPDVNSANLAVDFFFLLSGFVMACAYDERLAKGFSWGAAMRLRVIRLYPLIPFGVLLGTAVSMARLHVQHATLPGEGMADVLPTMLLFPVGLLYANANAAFGLDGPIWTLFFEFAASAAYASRLGRLRGLAGGALVVGLGLVLLASASTMGGIAALNAGSRVNFIFAFGRVGFPFALGVVFWRYQWHLRAPSVPVLALMVVLAGLLLAPVGSPLGLQLAYEFIAFPLLLLLGARALPGKAMGKACNWLGQLSYPLYILHYPISRGLVFALKGHLGLGVTILLLAEAVSLCVAWAALRWYDEPARRWLRQIQTGRLHSTSERGVSK
jgi:peptidoglycan/LPS O-acetylase OafA/YrhL